ncbi:MAG: hypothetical protein IPJ06_19955 [Saprospiraceae bacterium]|nr:hypothetical protein [Saprospiraceae bacterium]
MRVAENHLTSTDYAAGSIETLIRLVETQKEASPFYQADYERYESEPKTSAGTLRPTGTRFVK